MNINETVYRVKFSSKNEGVPALLFAAVDGIFEETTIEFSSKKTAMKEIRIFKKSKKNWLWYWGVEGPTKVKKGSSKK